MKIKKQEVFEQYKQIQKICIQNGEVMPILIDCIHIPKEYKLSPEEEYEISEKEISSREIYFQQSKIEDEIIKGKNEEFESLMEYWTDQLKQFLEKYPQFKNIIDEE